MGDLRHVETSHEQFIKIPFHTDGLHDLLLPGDVAADQSTELGASADAEKKKWGEWVTNGHHAW